MLKRSGGGGKDNPIHFFPHESNLDQNYHKQERQQDDLGKLFSGCNKLLSKQIMSPVEPSFRNLYYGGASGSVPFTWESQPGTPKHPSSDTSLPPLTPPPSYLSRDKSGLRDPKRSKPSFLRAIFSGKKSSHVSPSFSWSWSSGSSGSYSSPSMPMNRPLVKRSRSAVPFEIYEEEEGEKVLGHDQVHAARTSGGSSSTMAARTSGGSSTMCFGGRERVSRKFQGRRRMNKVRNALMSIVGHYNKA